MTELITAIGIIVIASGLGVAVWSFRDTKKEYARRKRSVGD